ncbi:MAG TPA: nucleotide exchange factor GrpE [Candidatus Moranbacteria bacterium]|nr:nucleotide exchange factor GrpE [Candidatus Moranbacteria bacterium]HRZ33787.1 nucleotide exchange factor GrpE [Candidatus Moranbacteria bacterium]
MTDKKQKSNEKKYPEAIVGALIINSKEEILLGESKKWKGKWTVFGGHVELGEKTEEAIAREIKEETGLDVKVEAQLDFSESIFDKDFHEEKHFIFLDYVCRYEGDEKVKVNGEFKKDGYKWLTIEEAKKMNLAVGTEQAIEKYSKYKEQKSFLDGWKRCQADFENYKKMQAESQKEFMKYVGQNIVMQIIPVLDNFHMSTDHIPEDQKDNAWVVGIMHIQKQLENVLIENGVEEILTKEGDKFDPAIHEAIQDSSQEKGERKQEEIKGIIKKITFKGYKLNGKVLRAVKVIVE